MTSEFQRFGAISKRISKWIQTACRRWIEQTTHLILEADIVVNGTAGLAGEICVSKLAQFLAKFI